MMQHTEPGSTAGDLLIIKKGFDKKGKLKSMNAKKNFPGDDNV